MATDNELERIAHAAHDLRPDWPVGAVLQYLRNNHMAVSGRDLAVALSWIAFDPKTVTPARLKESGPWWVACNAEMGMAAVTGSHVPRQPKLHEATTQCPGHPGEYRSNCRSCAADKLAEGNR